LTSSTPASARAASSSVHSGSVQSVTRPIKELKGFQKVFLKAGETETVAIDITPEALAFLTSI
jgi:hypothetical protein